MSDGTLSCQTHVGRSLHLVSDLCQCRQSNCWCRIDVQASWHQHKSLQHSHASNNMVAVSVLHGCHASCSLPGAEGNNQIFTEIRENLWKSGDPCRMSLANMPLDAPKSGCGSTISRVELWIPQALTEITLATPANVFNTSMTSGGCSIGTAEWQLMSWALQQDCQDPLFTDSWRRTWRWPKSVRSLCLEFCPRNRRTTRYNSAIRTLLNSIVTTPSWRKWSPQTNLGSPCLSLRLSKDLVNGCRKDLSDPKRHCACDPQGKQCWFCFLTLWASCTLSLSPPPEWL